MHALNANAHPHSFPLSGGVHDLAVLQAAVLHDTVEDTDTTLDELEREFGVEVRK